MTEAEAVLFLIDAFAPDPVSKSRPADTFPGIRVTRCPASVRRDVLALAERRTRG